MFADVLKQAMTTQENQGDYVKDGLLHCGRCNTPKQVLMSLPVLTGDDTPHPFPILCKCEREKDAMESEEKAAAEFSARMGRLWAGGVHDPELLRWRFEDDDGGQAATSNVCRRYVEKWPQMLENNVGLLVFGPVGVGKSFFASCILNEVLKQRVPICATSFGRILNVLASTPDKQAVLDRLKRFKLLLLDDLGSERVTEYATEQVFSVIDARNRAKLPTIFTTNLSLREMESPQNLAYSRIFDRVLEMAPVRLCVTGESRRKGNAANRMQLARELLL